MTVNRNLALIETMKAQLEGREKAGDGKKTAKPQDVVRMYDNIIQNMEDITELAGLETDEDLAMDTKSKKRFYQAFRSYYIAQVRISLDTPTILETNLTAFLTKLFIGRNR